MRSFSYVFHIHNVDFIRMRWLATPKGASKNYGSIPFSAAVADEMFRALKQQ